MDTNVIATPYWFRPLILQEREKMDKKSSKTNVLYQHPMYLDIYEQNFKEAEIKTICNSSTCLIDGDKVFGNENGVEEKRKKSVERHFSFFNIDLLDENPKMNSQKIMEADNESNFQKALQPAYNEENNFGFELIRKCNPYIGDNGWFNITLKFSVNMPTTKEKLQNSKKCKCFKDMLGNFSPIISSFKNDLMAWAKFLDIDDEKMMEKRKTMSVLHNIHMIPAFKWKLNHNFNLKLLDFKNLKNLPKLEYSQDNSRREKMENEEKEKKEISHYKDHLDKPNIPENRISDAEFYYRTPIKTRTDLIPILTCQGYENITRRNVYKNLMFRRKLTSKETVQQKIISNPSMNKKSASNVGGRAACMRATESNCETSPLSHDKRRLGDNAFQNSPYKLIMKNGVDNVAHEGKIRRNNQVKGNKYPQQFCQAFKRNQSLSSKAGITEKRINELRLNFGREKIDQINQKTMTNLHSERKDKILPKSKSSPSNRHSIPCLSRPSKCFNNNPELEFKERRINRIKDSRKRRNVSQPVLERNRALVAKTKTKIMCCSNESKNNLKVDLWRSCHTMSSNSSLKIVPSYVRENISDSLKQDGMGHKVTDVSGPLLVSNEVNNKITILNTKTAESKIFINKKKINLENKRSYSGGIPNSNNTGENYLYPERKRSSKDASEVENIKLKDNFLDKIYSHDIIKSQYDKDENFYHKIEKVMTSDSDDSNAKPEIQSFEGIFSIEGDISCQLNGTFPTNITKNREHFKTGDHSFHKQDENALKHETEMTTITSKKTWSEINYLRLVNDFQEDDIQTKNTDSLINCEGKTMKNLNASEERYVLQEHFFRDEMEKLLTISRNSSKMSSRSLLGKNIPQEYDSLEDSEYEQYSEILNRDVTSNTSRKPVMTSLLESYLHRKSNIPKGKTLHQKDHTSILGNVRKIKRKSNIYLLEENYFNLNCGHYRPSKTGLTINVRNNQKNKSYVTQENYPEQQFEELIHEKECSGRKQYVANLDPQLYAETKKINFSKWKSHTFKERMYADNIHERKSEFPQMEIKITDDIPLETNMLDDKNLKIIYQCASLMNTNMNTFDFPSNYTNFDFLSSSSEISQKIISDRTKKKKITVEVPDLQSLLKEEKSSQSRSVLHEHSEKRCQISKMNLHSKPFWLWNTKDTKPKDTHFILHNNNNQYPEDKIENRNPFSTHTLSLKGIKKNVSKGKRKNKIIQGPNLQFQTQITHNLHNHFAKKDTHHSSRIMRNNTGKVLSFHRNESSTLCQTLSSYLLQTSNSFKEYSNLLKKEIKDCRNVMRRNYKNKI